MRYKNNEQKRLLLIHRNDYKKLKKDDLIKIIEEELRIHNEKVEKTNKCYKPIKSTVNNSKQSIKRLWHKRKNDITKARIKRHIAVLRSIKNGTYQKQDLRGV
jgi:diphthamide synthase subunit DPH2